MKYTFTELPLSNSFATLGEAFFTYVQPTPFKRAKRLVHFNHHAAELLNLQPSVTDDPQLLEFLTGAQLIPDSQPLAMLYAGHQFGHFVPQLGDGRAILLGETTNQRDEKWEIQLKGSGLTPYSRDGDGRAVLRSTIREYLCSEAMHALGIPSTRALCIVGSDDEVYRERIETGAILTRLAPSHVRFGSFEVFYYRNQHQHIRTLADYVIEHHFATLKQQANPYVAWLDEVIDRTAALIAQWQAVGFSHGVMNSDNMSVLGLTLDYGPYGFIDAYDPKYICNHSDYQGRYAFDQQPNVGLFNLSCFAQAILPVLANGDTDKDIEHAVEAAREKLQSYQPRYVKHYAARMRAKLGLVQAHDEDEALVNDLLDLMAHDKVDFTNLFRGLCYFSQDTLNNNHTVRDMFIQREKFDQWAARYRQRLINESSDDTSREAHMKSVNPKYILRNYMAENAIRMAEDQRDYSEVDRLMTLLQAPFDEHPESAHYADPPPDWAGKISISCSS